jgi:hypothetical protein
MLKRAVLPVILLLPPLPPTPSHVKIMIMLICFWTREARSFLEPQKRGCFLKQDIPFFLFSFFSLVNI